MSQIRSLIAAGFLALGASHTHAQGIDTAMTHNMQRRMNATANAMLVKMSEQMMSQMEQMSSQPDRFVRSAEHVDAPSNAPVIEAVESSWHGFGKTATPSVESAPAQEAQPASIAEVIEQIAEGKKIEIKLPQSTEEASSEVSEVPRKHKVQDTIYVDKEGNTVSKPHKVKSDGTFLGAVQYCLNSIIGLIENIGDFFSNRIDQLLRFDKIAKNLEDLAEKPATVVANDLSTNPKAMDRLEEAGVKSFNRISQNPATQKELKESITTLANVGADAVTENPIAWQKPITVVLDAGVSTLNTPKGQEASKNALKSVIYNDEFVGFLEKAAIKIGDIPTGTYSGKGSGAVIDLSGDRLNIRAAKTGEENTIAGAYAASVLSRSGLISKGTIIKLPPTARFFGLGKSVAAESRD